jgi:hypothetical protein
MATWGLGLEHEFILQFENKKMIGNTNYNHFINSVLVRDLYKNNEINFYKKYKSYIKNNNEYKDYIKNLEELIIIENLAIEKKKYPLEKKEFFDIITTKENNKNIYVLSKNTIQKLNYYIYFYIIHHIPLLAFTYIFNNEEFELNLQNEILVWSDNKEYLIKENYYLINNIFDKVYIKNLENKVLNHLYFNSNSSYELNRILSFNKLKYKKINNKNSNKNSNSIKSIQDFIQSVNNQVNKIKNYLSNNIEINPNIIKNIFFCYKHNIPELDAGYDASPILEMMTIDYKNKNYESTYKEFIKYESSFVEYMSTIINHYLKVPNKVIIANIGSRYKSIELIDIFNLHINDDLSNRILKDEAYNGSYHIWVTIPYDKSLSKSKFLDMHATLANKLQLLEPLFACNFSSPSYKIKNNNNYPSKTSLRHLLNAYANYGTTDVSLINNGSDYSYVSNIFFNKTNHPKIHEIKPLKKKIYNQNNKLIKNYGILQERLYSNNVFSFITSKTNNSKNNVHVESFYELLFKNKPKFFKIFQKLYSNKTNDTKIPKTIGLGADIRTRNNNDLMHPLDENCKKVYYPKNNKYIEYYFDTTTNKLLNNRKYDKKKYDEYLKDQRVGFEFRILDHFPSLYLDMILGLYPYLVINSYDNNLIQSIDDTHVSKQFWHNEMFKVISEGPSNLFSTPYLAKLNKEFSINVKPNKLTSESILEELYFKLKKKYNNSKKHKQLLDKIAFKNDPTFFNFTNYATKFIQSNN